MPGTLLPLFPLGVVLFPDTVLPLHIFEDRYKEMIGEAIEHDTEFGVVLAVDRGIVNTGCTARVIRVVEKYEDGRLDILTLGHRRFELESLDHDRAYLRGSVEFFTDDVFEAPPALRQQAIAAFHQAFPAGREPGFRADLSALQLSFQLAQAVADLNVRQTLLQMRSEEDRLRRLIELLPELGRRQEIEDRMRTLAPRNGHGHHLT